MLTFAIAAMLAQASALDRPIDTKPTVKSEIHRGASAADACERRADPMRSIEFTECVADVQASNRIRMSQGYEAFEVGLYGRAVTLGRNQLKSWREIVHKDDRALAASVDLYDTRYTMRLKALALSPDEVRLALLGI